MSPDQNILLVYAVFWAARISPFLRRWKLPLLRGPEWFLSVNVRPGFYEGPGREILRRYHLRLLLPFVIDVAAATLIFTLGKTAYLVWLFLFLAVFIHANQAFSVAVAERRARAYAVEEAAQPAAAMVLSLKPRRLADYTNFKVEMIMAVLTAGTLAWLAHAYYTAPQQHSLKAVFGAPLLLLYSNLGVLFVKWGLVAWRTPLPIAATHEHMEARERVRKYHLKACDVLRASFTVQLLLWPVSLKLPPSAAGRFITVYVLVSLGLSFITIVWQERRRNELLRLARGMRPVFMKDSLDGAQSSGWLLCYCPEVPVSLVKNMRGYALNLANARTQLGAAYLVGFVMLALLLKSWH